MRLLLDEDSQAKTLIRLLMGAGHDVLTVDAAGLTSMDDAEVLGHAIQEDRVLITRNCRDFLTLHRTVPEHPGILAVYQDSDPMKSMSYVEIVRAVGNLAASEVPRRSEFIVLNAWRW